MIRDSGADLLATAQREARAAGLTRLADITRLDVLGISVWQAIRPWSRSVSVHQGKGLDPLAARIGACIEAIECDCAERFVDGQARRDSFDALPVEERAPAVDDFARVRGGIAGDRVLDWTMAELLDGRGMLWVPVLAVSLDLTEAGEDGIERSSNGQGGGVDLEGASLKGLCELIERDAFQVWTERSALDRAGDAIDPGSIDYLWFTDLRRQWRELGVLVRVFRLPAVVDVPAIAVEVFQIDDDSACRRRAVGTCVHPEPERALLGAVLEAAQARLGEIAGSREDVDPDRPETEPGRINFAPPSPPGSRAIAFHSCWPEPVDRRLPSLAGALGDAGYRQTARIILSVPEAGIKVVKLFSPGLGALGRSRRAPVH